MEPVTVNRKLRRITFHPHDIQQICHPFRYACCKVWLYPIINLLFKLVFITDSALYVEKCWQNKTSFKCFPSNQSGRMRLFEFLFSCMTLSLLFQSLQPFFQFFNGTIPHQSLDCLYPLLQVTHDKQICQMLDRIKHLAGFHKTVIQFFLRRNRRILHFPVLQKMEIWWGIKTNSYMIFTGNQAGLEEIYDNVDRG